KPARRAKVTFSGGSAPSSHALNVARLIPSITAVRRSLSSLVYRPNALITSSVVISPGDSWKGWCRDSSSDKADSSNAPLFSLPPFSCYYFRRDQNYFTRHSCFDQSG